MAWTFAHPAAVLFLRGRSRRPPSFSGLVAGRIAPDVGDYIHRFDLAATAHTAVGVVTACVPVGLVLVAARRAMHRPRAFLTPQCCPCPERRRSPLRDHLPGLAVACPRRSDACHVGSFTHRFGYVVIDVEFLRQPVFGAMGEEFDVSNCSTQGRCSAQPRS